MSKSTLTDIQVPVEVVLGGTVLTVEDLSRIAAGSLIELTKRAGEPVDLRAAGNTIAKGEVIVIDECFGLRVTDVISQDV